MPVGNAADNAWEIRRYGEVNTYDGAGGVDSLSFERLPRSYFTITQNADGSVTVPTALRPYMGGQERLHAVN